jgi:hypothetical protein
MGKLEGEPTVNRSISPFLVPVTRAECGSDQRAEACGVGSDTDPGVRLPGFLPRRTWYQAHNSPSRSSSSLRVTGAPRIPGARPAVHTNADEYRAVVTGACLPSCRRRQNRVLGSRAVATTGPGNAQRDARIWLSHSGIGRARLWRCAASVSNTAPRSSSSFPAMHWSASDCGEVSRALR